MWLCDDLFFSTWKINLFSACLVFTPTTLIWHWLIPLWILGWNFKARVFIKPPFPSLPSHPFLPLLCPPLPFFLSWYGSLNKMQWWFLSLTSGKLWSSANWLGCFPFNGQDWGTWKQLLLYALVKGRCNVQEQNWANMIGWPWGHLRWASSSLYMRQQDKLMRNIDSHLYHWHQQASQLGCWPKVTAHLSWRQPTVRLKIICFQTLFRYFILRGNRGVSLFLSHPLTL